MRVLRHLIPVAVLVGLACTDQMAPQANETPVFAKGGRWATLKGGGTGGDATEPDTTLPDGGSTCASDGSVAGCVLRHLPDAPPLETYSTSFTVVQGEYTVFVIHYLEPADDGIGLTPFMKVTIPKAAKFVGEDGKWLRRGDTLQVTVELDEEYYRVDFGPHGSRMGEAYPAELWFSLKHADMSGFGSDGAFVFYRPQEGDPWTGLDTEFYRKDGYLFTWIHHFSGYAVAW